jgi:putative ABC transport system permease protein
MSRWLTQIRLAVRSLFRRPKVDQELDEEFRYHLERQIEDNLHRGLAPEEARHAAMREMGPIAKSKEECRDARRVNWTHDLSQDLSYGLRMLRKSPGFATVAVLTLALGIGVTTAILSIVDLVLFRPLPYGNADRLVSVGIKHTAEPFEFMLGSFYYNWSDHQTAFTEMTAQSAVARPCDLTDRDPMRLTCGYVHQNFLPTLGIRPVLGSNFTAEDMLPDAPLSVMLSYQLWKARYNEQPSIVHEVLEIDGVKAQVIAVLPQNFEMPSAQPTDLLLPRQVDVSAVRAGSLWETMRAFARLKSGVTVAQARASLEPLFMESIRLAPPQMRSDMHLVVRSLRDRQVHDVIPVAWIMLATVLVVLLVCCANAGSLFLARTGAREQEFAIRAALGAGKTRILRQTLTEGLLVSFLSAVVGCILAEALLRTLVALAPAEMSFLRKATLDVRILLATLVVSFACGIACGLLPLPGLRSVAIAARSARRSIRPNLRRILVVTQIASSAVLLSGAVLLLRSLDNIERQDIGINSAHILTVSASLSLRRYNTTEKRMDFFRRAIAALRGIPGVTSVAMTDSLPPKGTRHWYSSMAIAGKPPLLSEDIVSERAVTPDYFNALGIRILRGRGFSDADGRSTEHLIVINQELATLMFPDQDPLGQQIRPDKDEPFYRVIGIAADVRNDGLTERTLPEYDTLLGVMSDEWASTDRNIYGGTLIIRSALSIKTVAPWIRQRVEDIDPLIPIEVQSMHAEIRTLSALPRFETALLGFFAAAGLLMASIGLYGVTAYAATRRTNEIGIRIALGATRLDVLRLIMLEGLRLVLLGGAIGLVTALSAAHVLRSLLFEVGPYDPMSFVCVAVLLGLIAIAAIFVPAMRAMRVEPMVALRYE